jgi:glycine hydroxymethyltransferase
MVEEDMRQLADWIIKCLQNPEDEASLSQIRDDVEAFCGRFPVPGI